MNLINLDPFRKWDCVTFHSIYQSNGSGTSAGFRVLDSAVSNIEQRWSIEAWEVDCLW